MWPSRLQRLGHFNSSVLKRLSVASSNSAAFVFTNLSVSKRGPSIPRRWRSATSITTKHWCAAIQFPELGLRFLSKAHLWRPQFALICPDPGPLMKTEGRPAVRAVCRLARYFRQIPFYRRLTMIFGISPVRSICIAKSTNS